MTRCRVGLGLHWRFCAMQYGCLEDEVKATMEKDDLLIHIEPNFQHLKRAARE